MSFLVVRQAGNWSVAPVSTEIHEPKPGNRCGHAMGFKDVRPHRIAIHLYSYEKLDPGKRGLLAGEGLFDARGAVVAWAYESHARPACAADLVLAQRTNTFTPVEFAACR